MSVAQAERLFKKALPHIQSESIRAWANGTNRETWIKIVKEDRALLLGQPVKTPEAWAGFIVATAMG